MADAAIPLIVAGIGSILVISGIEGESLGEVLKGEFGKGTTHPSANPGYKGNRGEPETSEQSGSYALSRSGAPLGSIGSDTIGLAFPNPAQAPGREIITYRSLEREVKEGKLTKPEFERKLKLLQEGK